jgi:translation initiation factor 1A
MPNVKGGKNYKKAKHGGSSAPEFVECLFGQQYGRVIRILGNMNTIVYGNDGNRYFCHIRGGMRKKVWINSGDIVVISQREELGSTSHEVIGALERGDIIAKVDSSHYGLLKKDDHFNQRLLLPLETLLSENGSGHVHDPAAGRTLKEADDEILKGEAEDDIFDRDEEEEAEGEGEEEEVGEDEAKEKPNYELRHKKQAMKVAEGRAIKQRREIDDSFIDTI